MRALSFILSGKFAHFKKPDVNEHFYATYNIIPKPALLGLLGGIIGLGGYAHVVSNEKNRDQLFGCEYDDLHSIPEFYSKLKGLKIAIIPKGEMEKSGRFVKKIQPFNNSVGYASYEAGGNLIIKEQWLENPAWQILVFDDKSEYFNQISEFIINKKCKFIPYLGKNDHFADITDAKFIDISPLTDKDRVRIYSIFPDESAEIVAESDDMDDFLFSEYHPVKFDENLFYSLKKINFSNKYYKINSGEYFKFEDGAVCLI